MRCRTMAGTLVVLILAVGGCGDDGGGSSSGGDFCDKAREFATLSEGELFGDVSSPDDLGQVFRKMGEMIDELEAVAPAELEADLATFRDGWDDFEAVLEEYDWDLTKLFAAAAENPEKFQDLPIGGSSELEAISERVGDYIENNCGIDLGTTTG